MELVTIIQNGGPYVLASVFAFLYWLERTERIEKEKVIGDLYNKFTERMIDALNATSQATRDVTSAMATLNTTVQTVMMQFNRIRSDDDAR